MIAGVLRPGDVKVEWAEAEQEPWNGQREKIVAFEDCRNSGIKWLYSFSSRAGEKNKLILKRRKRRRRGRRRERQEG